MSILVLLNNFLHDFSAAGWLFGSLILWSILRRNASNGEMLRALTGMLNTVLFYMRFSVVGIVVFGILRALAYRKYEWNAAAGQDQVTLLIVKHVVLFFVFVWGLVYFLKARNLCRKANIEKTE